MKNMPNERVSPICLWCRQPIEKPEYQVTVLVRLLGRTAQYHSICHDIALANEQAVVEAEFIRFVEEQENALG